MKRTNFGKQAESEIFELGPKNEISWHSPIWLKAVTLSGKRLVLVAEIFEREEGTFVVYRKNMKRSNAFASIQDAWQWFLSHPTKRL
jgi:hypothetical protein